MYFLHRSRNYCADAKPFTDWYVSCYFRRVRKLIVLAPLLFAAACSKPTAPATTAAQAPASQPQAGNPEPVAPPQRAEVVIPSGTPLHVRLDYGVSTRRNRAGDDFTASLMRPVTVHGDTVIPAGTRFRGHLTQSAASGRLKGRAVLALTLDSFHVEGREVPLRTSRVERVGAAHKKRNAFLIGGGAGLGAAIGAIAGGGKGAAIGALAGGGAGTAGAAATGKEELSIPAESALVFTMRAPVRM